jgi:toxin ParE1/3/4
LEDTCARLESLPERGNVPKELRSVGISEYREIHFKPYRIIYRIFGQKVIVYCAVDGRQDMQSLLQRRLLR